LTIAAESESPGASPTFIGGEGKPLHLANMRRTRPESFTMEHTAPHWGEKLDYLATKEGASTGAHGLGSRTSGKKQMTLGTI